MAIAGMIFGIIAVVSISWGWVLAGLPNIILGALAIIFGAVGMKDEANKGKAVTGLVLGIVAAAVGVLFYCVCASAAGDIDSALNSLDYYY